MSIQEIERISPNTYFYDAKYLLKKHIYARSEEAMAAGDAARDAVRTVDEVALRAAEMRKRLTESIGCLPPSDSPLNPRTVGVVQCDGFHIEKIMFEARPGAHITANLYVPEGLTSPTGAVLFVCGHIEMAKHDPAYQRVCQYLVRAGLIVLAQDPIGQAERLDYYEPSLGAVTAVDSHDYVGFQCLPLGDGIARYFAHDAMRGIDYLLTRPEVDPKRIGITGNSGGGMQTCLMMVLDERIAAAAPVTFLMNRRSFMLGGAPQDAEQIWAGMTAHGFDHEDFLISMCPRPVRVLAVDWDFFPIEATKLSVDRCRRFWEMHGRAGCLDMLSDASSHLYTDKLAKSAAEFFAAHLLGREVSLDDAKIETMEPSKLWCTKSGQVRGEIEGARWIYDENIDRLAELEKMRASIPEAERRKRALSWLREQVCSGRRPGELHPRRYHRQILGDLTAEAWCWWSQEDLMCNAVVFRDHSRSEEDLPATIALWEGGTTCLQPNLHWIRGECLSGRIVVALDASGMGGLEPDSTMAFTMQQSLDFCGIIHTMNNNLLWIGDSFAALRTYDVLRCLDLIAALPHADPAAANIFARGRYSVYARLAAALDERIANVEVVDGLDSYAELVADRHYDPHDVCAVVLPNVLNYLDLPDLAFGEDFC